MDRGAIEARVDELRAAHPDRHEFVRAIQEFSETLGPEDREVLGEVLLSRQAPRGGFDVLERRREQGGWIRRTMRKVEESERKAREEPPR
jgi:hypothetical protein